MLYLSEWIRPRKWKVSSACRCVNKSTSFLFGGRAYASTQIKGIVYWRKYLRIMKVQKQVTYIIAFIISAQKVLFWNFITLQLLGLNKSRERFHTTVVAMLLNFIPVWNLTWQLLIKWEIFKLSLFPYSDIFLKIEPLKYTFSIDLSQ